MLYCSHWKQAVILHCICNNETHKISARWKPARLKGKRTRSLKSTQYRHRRASETNWKLPHGIRSGSKIHHPRPPGPMNQWRNLKIRKEKTQDKITNPRSPNPRQENPTNRNQEQKNGSLRIGKKGIKHESGSTSSTSARIEIPHLLSGEGIGWRTAG